ncbi:MAG: hypothetical protein OIF58_08655 [Cohaesibacter sp.]|nr:hypothetical protein [Cohaesibacter sp.]
MQWIGYSHKAGGTKKGSLSALFLGLLFLLALTGLVQAQERSVAIYGRSLENAAVKQYNESATSPFMRTSMVLASLDSESANNAPPPSSPKETKASNTDSGTDESDENNKNDKKDTADVIGHESPMARVIFKNKTYFLASKPDWETYLTVLVVIMLLIMSAILYGISSKKGSFQEFERSFLILVVICSGLFAITAGYSQEQAAPIFSLLGAIVGYMFAKSSDQTAPASSAPTPPAPTPPTPPLASEQELPVQEESKANKKKKPKPNDGK